MALGLDDVAVGVWESPAGDSGCTVVLPPVGTIGSIAVRGQAPGTREAAALHPLAAAPTIHAVVLAGGSAFGLAAADGAMRWLEQRGLGLPVPGGRIPIVGSAIIFDAAACRPDERPDAAAGWTACERAVTTAPPEGRAGAGRGARVAKVGGLDRARPGGQGVAVERHGDLVVGALVVNNAVGEVVDDDGRILVGTDLDPGRDRWPRDPDVLHEGLDELVAAGGREPAYGLGRANTVIGCVVTNARLDKTAVHRVADLAHGGIARAVVPAHTSVDGDALFGLATGAVDASVDLVAMLAVEACAAAARRGPVAAVHATADRRQAPA